MKEYKTKEELIDYLISKNVKILDKQKALENFRSSKSFKRSGTILFRIFFCFVLTTGSNIIIVFCGYFILGSFTIFHYFLFLTNFSPFPFGFWSKNKPGHAPAVVQTAHRVQRPPDILQRR